MPTVIFERAGDRPLVIDAAEGGALVDACDDHAAPVPFSCKSANCGTCLVEVLEGESELFPPGEEERALLAYVAPPASDRLACRAQMRPGTNVLRLRARRSQTF
jgi:2Fe-2S ferredoxin